MIKTIAILSAVYLLCLPVLLRLLAVAHRKVQIKMAMRRQHAKTPASLKNLPNPIWGVWKERLKFAFSDTRKLTIPSRDKSKEEPKALGVDRRTVFFGILGLGWVLFALIPGIVGYSEHVTMMAVGFVCFWVAIIYAIMSSRSVLTVRKQVLTRMFEIAQLKLGVKGDAELNDVVKVTKWENLVDPVAVWFSIPTAFSSDGEEGFLRHFNQFFGATNAWVEDVDEHSGFDYQAGEVYLAIVPPLPTMAPWDEHYVTAPGIASSWFPIGLGVKGGLSLPNEETGVIESVIGFDVAGEQGGEAKEHGLAFEDKFKSASPMILTAGATGSGKSLDKHTKVLVKKRT